MRECSFPKPFLQELAQFDYLNALGAGEVEVEAVVGTTDDPVDNGSGSNVLRLADLHVRVLGGKSLAVVLVDCDVGDLALPVVVDHFDALLDLSSFDVRDDSALGLADASSIDDHVSRFRLLSAFLNLVKHFQGIANHQVEIVY